MVPDLQARLQAVVTGGLSGDGSLGFNGPGTLTLSGSNSYSGGTNVNAGTLALNHASALGTSGTIAFGGGTLRFSASNTADYSARFSTDANQQYRLDTDGQGVTLATALVSPGGSLTKLGTGTLALTAANTFTGSTRAGAGTLAVNHGLALQNSTLDMNASDTGSVTFAQDTTLGGLSGSRNLDLQTRNLAVGRNNGSTTYSGSLSNGSLAKQGTGTLTLSGSHSYSGPTVVEAGTLVVSGTIANSAVTVQSGGVLAGNGFLGSGLSVSGTLSPGSSPGTITTTSLTLTGSATTVMEIVGVTSGTQSLPGTAGTDYDALVVQTAGGLTYGGALSIGFSNTNPFATGTTFDLFHFTGVPTADFASIASAGSGVYANLSFSKHADGTWYSPDTAGGQYLRFFHSTGDLVVVPEPATWVTAALGVGIALAARRRHVSRKRATASAEAAA